MCGSFDEITSNVALALYFISKFFKAFFILLSTLSKIFVNQFTKSDCVTDLVAIKNSPFLSILIIPKYRNE